MRVSEEDREVVRTDVPKKNGKRKRLAHPRLTLDRGLSNLHALLRAPSFCRWPLQVLFFCEDVYEKWKTKRSDDLRTVSGSPQATLFPAGQDGLESIDASYSPLWPHLEKRNGLLPDNAKCQCFVCNGVIDNQRTALTCPARDCKMISHLTCLSKLFLKKGGVDSSILPISGDCPCCKTRLYWVDLVKELSLRLRGLLTVYKLEKRAKRQQLEVLESADVDTSDTASETTNHDDATDSDAASPSLEDPVLTIDEDTDPFGKSAWNDWRHIAGEDDATSNVVDRHDCAVSALRPLTAVSSKPDLPMVIEDSEGDSAKSLD